MEVITQYEIECYNKSDEKVQKKVDNILKECLLTLYVNNKMVAELECIFKDIEELVLGHLYTQGVITSISQVKSINIHFKENCVNVELSNNDFIAFEPENSMKLMPEHNINKEAIYNISGCLLSMSKIFESTGNAHSVALCREDEILYFCEDIGRYNALDKAIGFALKNNIDFTKTSLYTTGRMPSGIVKKVIMAGIPVLVSRSAPTDVSIKLAKKYNLSLIGFARGKSFNIYVN